MYDARDLRAAIALGRGPGALVIWSWPKGEMALYRHLRTLNLVKIPNEARAEAEAAGEDVSGMPACETVLFRHWDPNVLGVILPVLTFEQAARLMGPATGLAFAADGEGPVLRPGLPAPPVPPPPLRFSPEQMAGMGQGLQVQSYRKIERYLYSADPELMATWPIDHIRRGIVEADKTGRALGLITEKSLGQWTYLEVASNGAFGQDEAILKAFHESPWSPADTLDAMYDVMIHVTEQGTQGTCRFGLLLSLHFSSALGVPLQRGAPSCSPAFVAVNC